MVLCGFFGSVTKSKFSALDTNTVRAWVPLFWWTWSCGETETQGFRKLEYLMRPVSHAHSCIMLGTVTGNLWPLYIRLSNGGIVIEILCLYAWQRTTPYQIDAETSHSGHTKYSVHASKCISVTTEAEVTQHEGQSVQLTMFCMVWWAQALFHTHSHYCCELDCLFHRVGTKPAFSQLII